MGFFDKKDAAMEAAAVEAANIEEKQERQEEEAQDEAPEEATPKRKPFALWEVGGKTYKLKLRTPAIVELEQKYKTNLMNIMGSGQGGMPALSVMLDVAHAAMKDWQHGITKNEVQSLFSKYVEEGGSQLSFYMTVYMEIFTVSGFFSVNLSNQMSGALQEAKEEAL
nr:MAG TPA: tail assembly chaperone [Caudoviricetes sp.]